MKTTISQAAVDMTKDEYRDFIAGIRKTIDVMGLIQKEVAVKAGVSHVNFSKVLNHRIGSSAKYRHKICKALGVSEEEMVKLGGGEKPPEQVSVSRPPIAPLPADYLSVDDIVQTLSAVSASFIKTDARLKF